MVNKNLGFRYLNHIDALRAVSVIFVILFHLNPKLFSYGYLGVDIFFVISGYVITNSLYMEQIKKNKNIIDFYIKRIKRIFPILFLVIFSFLIFYIFLSPLKGDTNYFLKSALSGLFGLSNFYFNSNDLNYFLSEEINPLLHTWSLGIEEQFYLIYPILLIFLFKFLKGNLDTISNYLFLLIMISFLIYYYNDGFFGNFYSPLARFWEIMFGCIAFFYSSFNQKKKRFLFIIFFFISIFFLKNLQSEKIIQHSNFIASALSFILIVKTRNVKNLNFNLFLNKSGLIYLGKLSYSLYLWHLPVLYFCEIYFSGLQQYMIFLLISFGLSVLSYHFYENPIRRSNFFSGIIIRLFKNIHYITLFFLIISISISSNLKLENYYNLFKKLNYPENKLQKYLTRLDFKYSNYLNANCIYENKLRKCIKNNDINNSIYLTGDSHSDHFLISIDNIDYIDSYFHNNFAQCKIIFSSIYNTREYDALNNCKQTYSKDYENIIIDRLNDYSKKVLIVSLRLSDYLDTDWKLINNIKTSKKEVIINNYQEFINLFPKKKIILITTVPESKIHSEKCIFNEFLRKKIDLKIFNKCHFEKTTDLKRYNKVKEILNIIALKNNNVDVFDPYHLLCPLDICHNYDFKKDFFMLQDGDHLSIEASKFISKDLSSFLKKNFK